MANQQQQLENPLLINGNTTANEMQHNNNNNINSIMNGNEIQLLRNQLKLYEDEREFYFKKIKELQVGLILYF